MVNKKLADLFAIKFFLNFGAFFLFIMLMACAPVNNAIEGFKPNNPASKTETDTKIKSSEFVSAANAGAISSGGYKLKTSFGSPITSAIKTSQPSQYKVSLTVQGQLNSIK